MSKKAVLLVNLGSPDSPSVRDVRRYLREFLMDPRVLDAPYPIRFFVVHCCILPFRPRQSAEAYHKIWLPEGSPLVVTSRKVRAELQRRLGIPVELAMRYQNPSIETAIRHLEGQEVSELFLIPLFPHYAMSSFETAVERVKTMLAKLRAFMTLTVIEPYYDRPEYIAALAGTAADYLKKRYDHLLMTFHGLPERHLLKTDPTCAHCLFVENCCEATSPAQANCYRAHCFKTAEAFAREAGVTKYSVAFQSRLGKEPWMKPYTDQELVRLARDGVKELLVICPSFVSDCLETLEEIGMRGREIFLRAGGGKFTLIPALNDHPLWIDALENMVCQAFPTARLPTKTR